MVFLVFLVFRNFQFRRWVWPMNDLIPAFLMHLLTKAKWSFVFIMGMVASTATPAVLEAPMLRARVEEGLLPPVEERIPDEPLVIQPGTYGVESNGRYGGVPAV